MFGRIVLPSPSGSSSLVGLDPGVEGTMIEMLGTYEQ
jgi:hypothetical protein